MPTSVRGSKPPVTLIRGFTLLELLVVLAIIGIATAGVTLALRDSNATALEREADRVAALLELARTDSRSSGVPWIASVSPAGLVLSPVPAPAELPAKPWTHAGTSAQLSNPQGVLILGPEPMIAAQTLTLSLAGRALAIGTNGLTPFSVSNPAP